MGDGKPGIAPCGHPGVHVIGTYIQCPICDKKAVPRPIETEKTQPTKRAYPRPMPGEQIPLPFNW
jgi:hypothetical protein